jgi:curved DNA-binding protein CbpA
MKFHPDKFGSNPEKQEKALELMKEINQAFQEKDLDKLQKMEAQ